MATNGTQSVPVHLPAMDPGSTVLTTAGYLLLVLGIIYLAYWLVKRFGLNAVGMQNENGPHLKGRLMLGNRQHVSVVRYRDKELLLGVTDDKINLLAEYDADGQEEKNTATNSFSALLKRSTNNEAE